MASTSPKIQVMTDRNGIPACGRFVSQSTGVAIVGSIEGYFLVRLPAERPLKHNWSDTGWMPTEKELKKLVIKSSEEALLISGIKGVRVPWNCNFGIRIQMKRLTS